MRKGEGHLQVVASFNKEEPPPLRPWMFSPTAFVLQQLSTALHANANETIQLTY